MAETSYFFPPAEQHVDLSSLDKEWPRLQQMLNELSRSWCPACRCFVKKDEVHIPDGRTCHKIVNIVVP